MNDRKLTELAGLLDDDFIVKAAGTVGRKEKHMKKRSVLKTALIAACACLALVGTAFAASALTGGNWPFHLNATDPGVFAESHGDGRMTMTFNVKQFGPDEVSDEALKIMNSLPKGETRQEGMGSWKEIQEHIGVDLIDNNLLDTAEPANYWPLQCYNATYYWDGMNFYRAHIVDGVTVSLSAAVEMAENGEGAVSSVTRTLDESLNHPYTLPDGTVVYYGVNEYDTWGYPVKEYRTSFVHDGVSYYLEATDTQVDQLDAKNELTEGRVLDLEDPHADYEGVFFRVLDSFVN